MFTFELLGDSNISRSWKSVASDSDRLKGSVLRSATTLVMLKDSLRTVSQSTKFLIVAALSNPISKIVFDGTEPSLRVELNSLFEETLDLFVQTLNCNPDLQVMFYPMFWDCKEIDRV